MKFVITIICIMVVIVCTAMEMCPAFTTDAVREWRKKADAGDAEAQFLYAWHLMKQPFDMTSIHMGDPDVSNVVKYASMSSKQGYHAADMILCAVERDQWLLQEEKAKGLHTLEEFEELEKAAKAHKQKFERMSADSLKWMEGEVKAENPIALFQMGLRWMNGWQDGDYTGLDLIEKSITYFRKAAGKDYAPAKMKLAELYEKVGHKISEENFETFVKLVPGAKQIDGHAKIKAAFVAESFRWIKSAAEQGMPQAMHSVGYYHDDDILEKIPNSDFDYDKALEWYRKTEKAVKNSCAREIHEIEITPRTFMGIEFGKDLREICQVEEDGKWRDRDGFVYLGECQQENDHASCIMLKPPKFRMFAGTMQLEGCPTSRKIYGIVRQSAVIQSNECIAEYERTCNVFRNKYGENIVRNGNPRGDEYVPSPEHYECEADSFKVGKMVINIGLIRAGESGGHMILHVFHEGYRKLAERERRERMESMDDGADVL